MLAALLLASLWPRPPLLPAQEARVAAAGDTSSGHVSLLEAGCRAAAVRLTLGGRVHEVAAAPGGRRAYVAHSAEPAGPPFRGAGARGPRRTDGPPGSGSGGTAVTVLDLGERRVVGRFGLGRTERISDVWAAHRSRRLWVAAERDGRVVTLDGRTGERLMEWTIGRTSAQSGAVSRNDRYLFVTNREAGTLTVIDRVTVAANTVHLDRGAGPVALAPGGEAWVADVDDGRLWAVDGRSGRVQAELPSAGGGPVDLRRRPGGDEMWVLHGGSGDLQVFGAYRRSRVGGIALPGRPRTLRFSDDGRRALVTVPDRGLVLVVDAVERRVEDSVRVPLPPGDHREGSERTEAPGCVR